MALETIVFGIFLVHEDNDPVHKTLSSIKKQFSQCGDGELDWFDQNPD